MGVTRARCASVISTCFEPGDQNQIETSREYCQVDEDLKSETSREYCQADEDWSDPDQPTNDKDDIPNSTYYDGDETYDDSSVSNEFSESELDALTGTYDF